ncbi:MurR/RpiR family transcriptional regulator [Stappia taiwanensis]|uniref:MurR/RpiR family transcriptional regulator n=1 Tax=Stappia taiwanensis TaxID=992267 RepID=A0A838XYU2_9HYPH|nr:MurR/RpiR family transcriptional regulator [Stappia taiwanensis]MBA4613616.1 MurR/RpiR family transcriptional regulator [Stappia taiwanensis]GGE98752.1 RpiR family transcriptional regulator [Stappia taiwanensis]
MTKSQSPSGFLSDLITQNAARLTGSDTRLLDVLVKDPLRAALENGKEVSNRAGVHPAAAVRLAKRLGFEGYPEFRAYLQASLVEEGNDFENPAARMAARLVCAEEGRVLASVLDSEIAALEALRNAVSDGDIRNFSETLRGARKVFIFGRGHAASLSALIALRLQRSGYDAADLGDRTHHFAEMLNMLSPDDVVWLLAFRSPSQQIRDANDIAFQRGAKRLALTDLQAARLDPMPDHQICAARGEAGESQSLVVPMTIANAVILDLAGIDDGKSLKSLEAFKAFRQSLPARWQR